MVRKGLPNAFPSTRLSVLQAAADGEWEHFYREYLEACVRETAIGCRARGLPLQDVDDLIQDLFIRLQQSGGFGKQWREELRVVAADPQFRGNVPAKYLYTKRLGLASAKFRTYLKSVIRRIVLEWVRTSRTAMQQRFEDQSDFEKWLDESVGESLDRNWIIACLERAACILAAESRAARTKGARRAFALLYFSSVKHLSDTQLAERFGVHRATVAGIVKTARQRFIRLLEQESSISDRAYLRRVVAGVPGSLVSALQRAEGATRE